MNGSPTDPAACFALIIERLLEVIGMQASRKVMARPLVHLLCSRVHGLGKRLARVVEQIRAGTLPKPRVRDGEVSSREASIRIAALRPPHPFPYCLRGWLLRVLSVGRHEAAWCGLQVERLLREPEMAALIAAAPRQMGPILRSLCWMLKVDVKHLLPPAPKRVRAPAPAPAAPLPAGEAEPPCYAHASRRTETSTPSVRRPGWPSEFTPEDVALIHFLLAGEGLQRA